jgi:hypothetical protein
MTIEIVSTVVPEVLTPAGSAVAIPNHCRPEMAVFTLERAASLFAWLEKVAEPVMV